jgi:hypothetical protein
MPVPLCVSQYLFLQVKHLKSKALTPVEQLGSPHISTFSETGIEDQGIDDVSEDQGIEDLSSDLTSHQLTASDCMLDSKTGSRFNALTTCG